jgi:mRNA-degrading endonuclease toxin of MazEF toxin-antitoxin module
MDRAEVWLADLPAPYGLRPVLILSRSSAVRSRNQVVVAAITRTVHGVASEVSLTHAQGMKYECVVNCDTLLTIPKALLSRRITKLAGAKMDAVHKALRFALELPSR